MINILALKINKDKWACAAWMVFVITTSVGIQLHPRRGQQELLYAWQRFICSGYLACSCHCAHFLHRIQFTSASTVQCVYIKYKCHDIPSNGISEEIIQRSITFPSHMDTRGSLSQHRFVWDCLGFISIQKRGGLQESKAVLVVCLTPGIFPGGWTAFR